MNQELEILETLKVGPSASINQLLNQPLDTPISISGSLSFSQMLFNKENLRNTIEENHPMLRMYSLQQEISNKAIAVNELDGKPSFGVGMDYIMVNKRDVADLSGNGRDILQLRASVKIPLFRQKYEAKEKEESLKIEALEYKKADRLSKFMAAIDKAMADHESARLKVELYNQQIIITQAAINILESDYSASGKSFDELLRLEKDLIEYNLKIMKAIVKSHIAKSNIDRFVMR